MKATLITLALFATLSAGTAHAQRIIGNDTDPLLPISAPYHAGHYGLTITADQTEYQPGSNVTFFLTVAEATPLPENCLSDAGEDLQVSLRDPDGNEQQVTTVVLQNGLGYGTLALPVDAKAGVYTLEVVTPAGSAEDTFTVTAGAPLPEEWPVYQGDPATPAEPDAPPVDGAA